MSFEDQLSHRAIRSFVRRDGRMTPAQRQALERNWSEFGVDLTDSLIDFTELFGREALCFVEIGFGNGDALGEIAARHPNCNYLGIDVHRPGVGRLLVRLQREEIANVRVVCADVVEVLAHNVADCALDGVFIFFPDPWPKKRHHKRRLVQPSFVELLAHKVKPGGIVHQATDWQNYAEQMLDVMSAAPEFRNQASDAKYVERPAYRPLTKFERRGKRLGHGIWDLVFMRISAS